MNPASIMKMMKAKKYIYSKPPKVCILLQYAFGSGIPADSVIEIHSYKAGTGACDLQYQGAAVRSRAFESLKDLK